MKLFYTPTSPFVRKVLVVAHELGCAEQISLELLRPSPTAADATLSAQNPLNKIPTLVTDDGQSLFDSRVIVEYLDRESRLVPASGPERFDVLRTQALCDGVLDAGILAFYEKVQRPQELQWSGWIDGQAQKARQGLDVLEQRVSSWSERVDLGQICAGITIGWLEFRNVLGDIRADRPRLFGWYDGFLERPSMQSTLPRV